MDEPARPPRLTNTSRRRPATSCTLCRRRKIRCNRQAPCSNCVRSKTNESCVYDDPAATQRRQAQLLPLRPNDGQNDRHRKGQGPSGATRVGGSPYSSLSSSSWTNVPSPSQTSAAASAAATSVGPAAAEQAHPNTSSGAYTRVLLCSEAGLIEGRKACGPRGREQPTISSPLVEDIHTTDQGVIVSKTRLFGRSHWMNGAVLLKPMFERFEKLAEDGSSEALPLMHKCKAIARSIKAQRDHPSELSQPNSRAGFPSREVADKLVQGYMRTSECVYRVLHIPSFMADYEASWSDSRPLSPVINQQIKLVLAIGAASFDDGCSLRNMAIYYIHEAASSLFTLLSKAQLTIPSLQAMTLLCLAREAAGVGGDLVWISVGSLIRTAMYMGLHRDPLKLPKTTPLVAEMRRRLWSTILEIALQSSLDSGGPPMISTADFDTLPPANWDDTQSMADRPNPARYTQSSLSIILRQTFPIRLAIARFLNDIHADRPTYQETLRLDAELKVAYKSLSQTLRGFQGQQGPTEFELKIMEFFLSRYFLALHLPFFGPALNDAAFAYSRNTVIETSLKLWKVISGTGDMARLSLCAYGALRSVPSQACLVMAIELRAQLAVDEAALVPPSPRPDLLATLQSGRDWMFLRIKAGETNIKGHLAMWALISEIEAIAERKPEQAIQAAFVAGVETALQQSFAVLRDAAQSHEQHDIAPADIEAGWGWDMPELQYSFGDLDSFFVGEWLS